VVEELLDGRNKEEESKKYDKYTITVAVLGWEGNHLQIRDVVVDGSCQILPYAPSPLFFDFIGDSLTAGQYLKNEVLASWAWKVADHFKAERRISALPGIALTDTPAWCNPRGMSAIYDYIQDSGYIDTVGQDLTPWSPKDGAQEVSCIVVNIGTNDNGKESGPILRQDLLQTYIAFLTHLRYIYPEQPIIALEIWGWPDFTSEGTPWVYIYEGLVEEAGKERHGLGDSEVWAVDTKGWFTPDDYYEANGHPNERGQEKAAQHFIDWMAEHAHEIGIEPLDNWP